MLTKLKEMNLHRLKRNNYDKIKSACQESYRESKGLGRINYHVIVALVYDLMTYNDLSFLFDKTMELDVYILSLIK